MQLFILLLFYAYVVILFSYNVHMMQKVGIAYLEF